MGFASTLNPWDLFCGDYIIGASALLPLAVTFDLRMNAIAASLIVLGCVLSSVISFWLLSLLHKNRPALFTIAKFGTVGTMNSLLEMSIVNACMLATGGLVGLWFVGYKVISFCVASVNAYVWNKRWTFENAMPFTLKEYCSFVATNIIGVVLNITVASLTLAILNAVFESSVYVLTNSALLVAILVAMTWNFVSQRRIFKTRQAASSQSDT